ncbi:MAG: hypothetical protein OXT67_09835 [Zetaproteobacteria bacterium]|nr:hypothetical protein [Zetaproteobacteria bacterium]
MKKILLLLLLLSSHLAFAHPFLHSLDRVETNRRAKQPKVGDSIHVQTREGWKLAKVAKITAAGLLFATLTQGAEAGPFCLAGVVTACRATATFCVIGGLFTGGAISAGCLADAGLLIGTCQYGLSACALIP